MKPIFCIDVSVDKNNEVMNGEEFITKTVTDESAQSLEEKREELNSVIEKTKLALPLRILEYACAIASVIVLSVFVEVALESGFMKALNGAPLIPLCGIIFGVGWLAIFICARKKEKRVLREEQFEEEIESLDNNVECVYDELGVPKNADNVDVLMFAYKIKDGEIVPKMNGILPSVYFNADLKIFKTEGAICLADLEHVYSFSLSGLRSIKTVKEKITLDSWNKEEAHDEGRYEQSKMKTKYMKNRYLCRTVLFCLLL